MKVVTLESKDNCYHVYSPNTTYITHCGKWWHEWGEVRLMDQKTAVYLGFYACKYCFEIAGGVMFYPGSES